MLETISLLLRVLVVLGRGRFVVGEVGGDGGKQSK